MFMVSVYVLAAGRSPALAKIFSAMLLGTCSKFSGSIE